MALSCKGRKALFRPQWNRRIDGIGYGQPRTTDLCQDFGHGNSRFYAAIAIALSIGFVRSKNASITSAGIL